MVTWAGLGIAAGAVYTPELLIVPTVELPPNTPAALQVTVVPVRFCVEPSLYVPVAVNCWELPKATELDIGVTAIDTSVGGLPTVRLVEPTIPPKTAEIVVDPSARPVAKPVALIVATAALVELQETELFRFCVLPSV
jgi:hypothetical protein